MRFVPCIVAFLALTGATATCAQTPAASTAAEAQTQAAKARAEHIRTHYTKFEYRIPMRDGVHLFTAVYVPDDAGPRRRYPLLMTRTPYSVAPYGAERYRERLGPTAAYEQDKFIFVLQDVRGRHMSEGSFVDMRPQRSAGGIDETTDTHDSIDWLLRHVEHHNGKVGLWGISYPGFYASAGAIDSHPALKAVSPQAPIADWFKGDDMHRNGAFNLQLAFTFFSSFGLPRPKPTDDEERKRFEWGTPDAYRYFLELGPVANAAKRFEAPVKFFDEVLAHPDYDAFWQQRNLLPRLTGIKAAVLVVGGWYDTEDLYGPLQTYAAMQRQNPQADVRLVMGPWPHGGWTREAIRTLGDVDFGFDTSAWYQPHELRFFRQHLKDKRDAQLPEALVFETGANRWRRFAHWPPAQARATPYYLGAQGTLSTRAPEGAEEACDSWPSDPAKPVPYTQEIAQRWGKNYMAEDQRFVSSRPDVVVWQSAPLERDLTVAGPLEARMFFASTGTDADLVVKLVDVWPGKLPGWTEDREKAGERNRGGQQTLVRGEPLRLRYRNSLEQPEPLVAGQVTPVQFRLNDVFHTFQRGHRIMAQVQSSWFPFIDRNPQTFVPNIYTAKPEDFVRQEHRVCRDAQHPSALVLPVLDG